MQSAEQRRELVDRLLRGEDLIGLGQADDLLGGDRRLADEIVATPGYAAIMPADLDMQDTHLERALFADPAQRGLHLGGAQRGFHRFAEGDHDLVADGLEGLPREPGGGAAEQGDAGREIGAGDGITVLLVQARAAGDIGKEHSELVE